MKERGAGDSGSGASLPPLANAAASSDAGRTLSLWMKTARLDAEPGLPGDLRADVCVVGAGIAGLTTAYHLLKEGKSVVVLDDGPVGGGETGRTSAHLVTALDRRYADLEKLHGERGARLAAWSHAAAIDRIEEIAHAEDVTCDFERVDGWLFVPPGESQDVLEREYEATRRAGLQDVAWAERAPIGGYDTGRCLRFPRQAQFHPLQYLAGLARAVKRRGGRIFTGAHVDDFHGSPDTHVTTTGGATVRAGAIVVATNSPVNDRVAVHTKLAAYRTYVIGARVPAGAVPQALFWDTAEPFHYVRLQSVQGERDPILLVGGEDHRTGQADDAPKRWDALEGWMRERFSSARGVEARWSGQVLESMDGLGFIGANPTGPGNVFIVTGDSGNGLTHGTIAGILLSDLIQGRANDWATLYDPGRKVLRAAGRYASENANTVAQYADWLKAPAVKSVDEIAPDSGAVLQDGLRKIAVYRDPAGALLRLSATCPHLGCVVEWNSAEKTWDCPCHGSRFGADGHVVNGPARDALSPAADERT